MILFPSTFYADLPANFDGEFMWDFLAGAFLNNSKPTDFDAVVEREGGFLVFETKNPGATVPRAQLLAFERLVKISDRFTVVLCRKRPEQIQKFAVLTQNGWVVHNGDADTLRAWCTAWTQQQLDRRAQQR